MPETELTTQYCLTGSIIISTPKLTDHALEECIVYIYEHSPQLGAQGVVINRKSGLTVEDLLERMNFLTDNPSLQSPLYHGGLEDENSVAMIHTGEWFSSNTKPVTEEFSISSDTFMMEKLATGNEPANWIMCAGRCTWEPGELDADVEENYWITAPATADIVFSSLTETKQWRSALKYCTSYAVNSWF